jgi:hypothetical protein
VRLARRRHIGVNYGPDGRDKHDSAAVDDAQRSAVSAVEYPTGDELVVGSGWWAIVRGHGHRSPSPCKSGTSNGDLNEWMGRGISSQLLGTRKIFEIGAEPSGEGMSCNHQRLRKAAQPASTLIGNLRPSEFTVQLNRIWKVACTLRCVSAVLARLPMVVGAMVCGWDFSRCLPQAVYLWRRKSSEACYCVYLVTFDDHWQMGASEHGSS